MGNSSCDKNSVRFAEGTNLPSPPSQDITGEFLGNIDPLLDSTCSPHLMAGQWSHQQAMQQYLGDGQKTAFLHLSLASQPYHHNAARPVPIMPAASQPRYTSPFSFHATSSTCSSALSPTGGSDSNYEGNIPSTPPDHNMTTSAHNGFLAEMQLHHPVLYHCTGMATCVSLDEVNPNQELPVESVPNDNSFFEYAPRSYSYHSYSSQCELDYGSQQAPADFEMKRASSPEDIGTDIKDEIRIPDHRPQWDNYPPPQPEEDPYPSSAEEVPVRKPKREHDDDDYKPGRRSSKRRIQPAAAPRKQLGRPKNKRLVPSRSQQPDTKERKTKIDSLPTAGKRHSCPECQGGERFRNVTELQNHMNHKHNRHFRCVFDFAGCFSTFSSKNEWKRHVMSQHIVLTYWLCTQGTCAEIANPPSTTTSSSGSGEAGAAGPSLPNGSIFNRKDLFTQHLRRMHSPESIRRATKALQKKTSSSTAAAPSASSSSSTAADQAEMQEYEDSLPDLQRMAERCRCKLPTLMGCPSAGCGQVFEGSEAWDQRMEHVAKHLQREGRASSSSSTTANSGASGSDAGTGRVRFGGENDGDLVAWASRPDVAVIRRVAAAAADGSGEQQWELNNNRPTSAESGPGSSSACGGGRSSGSRGSRVVPRVMASSTVVVGGVGGGGGNNNEDVDAEGEEEE
ncbi:uncharacterized protein E0L32_000048 [Thyridium curvatum]|uniref:C2H2-type domain-containing protein n=1 Tax=Thyridium curvatum TaxID=1093900 RepID=A0A507BAU1_9PEZI|nr:uncharacterized protein E0L32_000048 [Thyridium curvatum]TPX15714.1 hypothetical protein E0L32_000048 [Thyridium curvatum]